MNANQEANLAWSLRERDDLLEDLNDAEAGPFYLPSPKHLVEHLDTLSLAIFRLSPPTFLTQGVRDGASS